MVTSPVNLYLSFSFLLLQRYFKDIGIGGSVLMEKEIVGLQLELKSKNTLLVNGS